LPAPAAPQPPIESNREQVEHRQDREETRLRPVWFVPVVIVVTVVGTLFGGWNLVNMALADSQQSALADAPKPVTVVEAQSVPYRPLRRYVATIAPWLETRVGPQFVSAYVDDVRVRPGSEVDKGDILAILDCRNTAAQRRAMVRQNKALEARQKALDSEVDRYQRALEEGYASPIEAERRMAAALEQQSEILANDARISGIRLEVNDCTLRAPFSGEVAARLLDPGAFARPGTPIVHLVDRSLLRIEAVVPESDFALITPGTPVRVDVLATGHSFKAEISRRAPAADPATRTVTCEIDIEDANRELPTGTTVELTIGVGDPVPAVRIPLTAAIIRGETATVVVVEDDRVAKRVLNVVGEREGALFVDTDLEPGTLVVTDGRTTLLPGEAVDYRIEPYAGPRIAEHEAEGAEAASAIAIEVSESDDDPAQAATPKKEVPTETLHVKSRRGPARPVTKLQTQESDDGTNEEPPSPARDRPSKKRKRQGKRR
jgi:RND family efflux transporter MFP subunit